MKTKVIAFRVTDEEHAALQELCDSYGNITYGKLFEEATREHLTAAFALLERRKKQFERKAKREAKKAAANVSE